MEKRKIFCLQKRKTFRFFGFDRILTKAEDIIMAEKRRRDFCIECRKETEYLLQKKEIDEQYRAAEGLVSIDDIEKLMKIYKIGKAPLSLALGFGEVTIPRYLEGQIPSREYSDVVRAALASPVNMKQKLMENRDKLTDAAYRKAMAAAEKEVIDLVANTFGMYGGKVLERVTHNEEPWQEARKGYDDSIPSSELLSKERIMKYYTAVNKKYKINTEEGLRTYIHDILSIAS